MGLSCRFSLNQSIDSGLIWRDHNFHLRGHGALLRGLHGEGHLVACLTRGPGRRGSEVESVLQRERGTRVKHRNKNG